MSLAWSTDVVEGDWLVARVHGFAGNVGSVVPDGFESYARVFHPIEEGPDRRWSDLAARNGRVVHAEMQFHVISRGPGDAPVEYEPLDAVSVGSLPRDELRVLAALLAQRTTTPVSCWFAAWEGFGQLSGSPAVGELQWERTPTGPIARRLRRVLRRNRAQPVIPGLAPSEALDGPRLQLPHRAYLLLHGAVTDATGAFDLLGERSPNLWWPEDHAWCVATEVDLGWTYVAGSEAAIADVLAAPDLEALTASVTDGITYDSDRVNAALDEP